MTDVAAGCTDQCRQITAAHDSERKRALAERDEARATIAQARRWIVNCVDPAIVGPEAKRDMLATLARVEALADEWAAGRAPTAAAELRAALATPEPAVDAGTGDATTATVREGRTDGE
jgi:hypothetical protein